LEEIGFRALMGLEEGVGVGGEMGAPDGEVGADFRAESLMRVGGDCHREVINNSYIIYCYVVKAF